MQKYIQECGGTDSYTSAISDIYQDNFDEGIFTGKGIYDLKIFHKILCDEIPENTVLSHDLLEGNYLRCGLATDILLLDGTPSKYNSYTLRASRWLRGDWQIYNWLKNTIRDRKGNKKRNPLNLLSKFKILDNLRRSLIPIAVFFGIILSVILASFTDLNAWKISLLCLSAYVFSSIIDVLNYIIFKKGKDLRFIYAYKNLIPTLSPIRASIIRGLLEILFLPHKMYISIVAIIKTIYRMNVTKMHLLEWLTAEEAEKQAKTDLFSYYKFMLVNLVFGVLLLAIGIITNQMVSIILGTIWLFAPYVAWIISKDIKKKVATEQVSKKEIEYLLQIGERTWKYFYENINEENNFLPPDNYQEDRKNKVAARTSPTNIGLGMLTIISAYDLNYITIEEALELLNKMVETIDKLTKWNGHLYNWYNTNTLEPLIPRYISTVDNGNFIGYLYTVKQFLIDTLQKGVGAGLDQPEINIKLGRSRPPHTNR